ncbi:hypothetical protein [Amycolatopsis cihanbeyliensis]|uniref:YtxH-like protein n=1 Tax=Amycolatopsis cihanbeyliensis TaxID=1128664 RepID=A0A542CTE8_AMYCI|nr:hypothetical protein [Amycolatopsis cihanbeyliensis]TQI94107.1 hypothetical protein FB471_6262 [Amycolatopsis cihanbeyliensis]
MKKFLLGAVMGYVLGTRAGRERYDQLVRTYRKIADHPAVQGAAGFARAKLGERLGERMPFARGGEQPAGHGANGHPTRRR